MTDENIIDIKSEQETFRFRLEGSKKVWELPPLRSLPYRQIREMMAKSNGSTDEKLSGFESLLDQYAPGLLDQATMQQVDEIIKRWSTIGNVSLGESSASPVS